MTKLMEEKFLLNHKMLNECIFLPYDVAVTLMVYLHFLQFKWLYATSQIEIMIFITEMCGLLFVVFGFCSATMDARVR